MSPSRLAELLGDWGYPTYLVLLCATGLGSPIPEDVILATAGYLISAGIFSWPGALVAGIAGVIASDVMLYGWGLRLRAGAIDGWLSRVIRPQHFARLEQGLMRFGDGAVFVARLLPGTRVVTFMGAGLRNMPFGRFLALDLAGAIIWVPIVLVAGAQVGEEIGGLDRVAGNVGRITGWTVLVIVLLAVMWRWWRAEAPKL